MGSRVLLWSSLIRFSQNFIGYPRLTIIIVVLLHTAPHMYTDTSVISYYKRYPEVKRPSWRELKGFDCCLDCPPWRQNNIS